MGSFESLQCRGQRGHERILRFFRKELVISCLIVLRFKAHIKVPATKARKTSLQIGLSREVYKTL